MVYSRFNVIKWTWFHKNYQGANVPVQNIVIDHAFCLENLCRWFEDEISEAIEKRGFVLHKRNEQSATFITRNGDFVNIRIC